MSDDDCARCRRFLIALREARAVLRRLEQQNGALQEELLAAGEMIEDLASELEALQK